MFRPSCLLGLQIAPTTVVVSQGSQTFYTTRSPVGYLPWEWYRYMPESGNWHDGTFTRWIAALSAAPRPCVPHRYSHPREGLSLEFLPYHRNDRFPRSTQEPGSGSRYLYAGRRPGSMQVPPGLLLVFRKLPVLTSSNFISKTH